VVAVAYAADQLLEEISGLQRKTVTGSDEIAKR
jgi:hypothetical protein